MPSFVKQYKDKEKCRITRNRQRNRNYNKTAIYEKREWQAWEERLVLAHTMPDAELSKLIHRGVRAIQIKRCRLKKGVK